MPTEAHVCSAWSFLSANALEGKEFPFSSGQENPVSSEATTNSRQGVTRQGIHGEGKKGYLLSPSNTSPKQFYE